MVYVTGDTHRDFDRIERFCARFKLTKKDILVILGDVGINFFGGEYDESVRESLSKLPITLFCIHGNHEIRPCHLKNYAVDQFNGGLVYVDPSHPNQVFAVDGETYSLGGHSCLVIGGAYSVDKAMRIEGVNWWADEQIKPSAKRWVEFRLGQNEWKQEIILSHTCPKKYTPTEQFLPGLEGVDDSMEVWLDAIESQCEYDAWYCGHWHANKNVDRMHFLFEDIVEL